MTEIYPETSQETTPTASHYSHFARAVRTVASANLLAIAHCPVPILCA